MSSPRPGAAHRTDATPRSTQLLEQMQRVARGDHGAFAVIYDATAPAVFGTALRVLRDRDLAAEVTQDVMVEVWRTAARFDPERGSVQAWVATMGHRRAVDRVRAVQAQRHRDDTAARWEYQRPYDDVEETVERGAERAEVLKCLDRLTDLQRDAVLRAYYGGLTYREVAASTRAALPTVKSRIRDGLNSLRRCLEVV